MARATFLHIRPAAPAQAIQFTPWRHVRGLPAGPLWHRSVGSMGFDCTRPRAPLILLSDALDAVDEPEPVGQEAVIALSSPRVVQLRQQPHQQAVAIIFSATNSAAGSRRLLPRL